MQFLVVWLNPMQQYQQQQNNHITPDGRQQWPNSFEWKYVSKSSNPSGTIFVVAIMDVWNQQECQCIQHFTKMLHVVVILSRTRLNRDSVCFTTCSVWRERTLLNRDSVCSTTCSVSSTTCSVWRERTLFHLHIGSEDCRNHLLQECL